MFNLRNHIGIAGLLLGFALALPVTSLGADFNFFSILRAGAPGSTGYEIGLGPNASSINSANTAQYSFLPTGTQTWRNGLNQNFRIGYDAANNLAYATVFNSSGGAITATYNGPLSGPVSSGATWTINPNNLFISAASRPVLTGIGISGLALQAGLTILNPITTSSMSAAQVNSNAFIGNSSPIVFQAASTGGSWYISGRILFQGLSGYTTNGASGSQLQLGMSISAVDSPEPTPFLLTGMGLVGLSLIRRRQKLARN